MSDHARKPFTAWFAVTILLLAAAVVSAQSLQTGDIQGTISDPSGAVIPGAKVTLKSLDTGSTQTTTANQSGDYRLNTVNKYSLIDESIGSEWPTLCIVSAGITNKTNAEISEEGMPPFKYL